MDERAEALAATIKRKRKNVKLTQRELAERAGLSLGTIRALEQALRSGSIGTLQAIAHALDVTIADLLAKAKALPGDTPDSGIVAIRRVLTSVDDLLDDVVETDEPVSLQTASRDSTYAWGAYWGGRYEELSALLAQAMIRARAAEHASSTKDREAAADKLAQLYQVASCTLVHLGHPDTAWLAWDRAKQAAKRGSDPLRISALHGSASWLLLTEGRYEDAVKVAIQTAEKIEVAGKASLPQLSVYGQLMLSAATATGRNVKLRTRAEKAADFLQEARAMAERTGERNDYESAFGRNQVIMQTADVQVVTEQYSKVLRTARQMPRDAGLPLAARSRHLTDVAFAQTRLGMDDHASNTVLSISASAPDWISHQTLYKHVVGELDARLMKTPLHELAQKIGANSKEL
ncbi:hypothetical protein BS329_38680 [Amycolatopsis coloradensis]|uniref:HTH cro/C1-type domain-containing protein n=1 Tax=Amycolatopsis coloradensis TaxID=76021 RepID=A0A1R0KEN6_9PSEU|nr:helix-turn-helix transcriptional regulator [Amycolatopsis coloradensis]OLZ43585.1 hypothetical protein BS329_38680 [Amycolatopsis coloradensis]